VKLPVLPHLVALSEGPNLPLDKPIVLIGRHQECDIQIPSRKISRRHCCIAQVNDHLVIRDLGSTNGIRINGVKVVEGNLQVDDELVIGNIRYQVKWHDDAPGTARAPENGIKAGAPHAAQKAGHDESREEPMPLPDMALSHPVLQGKPAPAHAPGKHGDPVHKPHSLEIPDNIGLLPLDPPADLRGEG
jgi:predicted component of type VI protein secretion system